MPDYSDFEYHRVQRIFYRVARNLALATVVVAPWLFGSAEPWAYLFLCIMSSASLGIFLLSKVCFPEKRVVSSSTLVALIVLLCLIVLQVIPLPAFFASFFNSVAMDAVTVRDALFSQMAGSVAFANTDVGGSLHYASASPAETYRAIYLFVAYLGIYIVLSNSVRSWKHVKWITTTVLISSFMIAVLALVHKFSGAEPTKIFWFHMPRYPGDIMGPFTNRNHFAFNMLMVFGLSLGLFCSMLHRLGQAESSDWREKLAWIDPQVASKIVLVGFAAAVFGASIFVSLSRGAVLSLLLATAIVSVIMAKTKDASGGRLLLWAAMFVVIAFVAWIGWDPILGRMGSLAEVVKNPLADTRAVATRDTLFILKDHPLLGCGFGCFKYVFPLYQGVALGPDIFLHAHNDWAQLLAEGGVLCAITFLAALIFFFVSIRRHYSNAIPRARRYVMGLLLGVVAVMLHSFLDYSLHKPSNAFLLSAVCGLMAATVHMSAVWNVERGVDKEEREHRSGNWSVKSRLIPFIALVAVAILVSMEMCALRRAVAFERIGYARRLVDEVDDAKILGNTIRSALRDIELVRDCDCCTSIVAREMASDLVSWSLNSNIDLNLRVMLAAEAAEISAQAIYQAPTDYLNWLWLGRAQVVLGEWKNSSICLERAKALRPYSSDVMLFEYNE